MFKETQGSIIKKMQASILTIGDEILNGTTIDTNSAYIAKKCVANGLSIQGTYSISDSFEGIYEGLELAQKNAEIIFITGGLGPTKDDITKQALANFFQVDLSFDSKVFEKIEAYFKKRGQKQVELNRKLAMIPSNAELLPNERGTAMGMWFTKNDKIFVSMPGVPHEMRHMLNNFVLPKIIAEKKLPTIINKYIMCAGIGESAIYERIEDIEANLPEGTSLAYLPNLGNVKLRLTTVVDEHSQSAERELRSIQEAITERIPKHVFSYNPDDSLAKTVGEMLLTRNKTLSTAESCTGGYISHLITSVPGSSKYFEGAVAAYSYDIKEKLLNVQNKTLNTVGAVSKETVIEMTKGLLDIMDTDYGIAVSGIAGPGGGTPEKPVGTVWIAVGNKTKVKARLYNLTNQREYNIKISAQVALNMLRNFIEEIEP